MTPESRALMIDLGGDPDATFELGEFVRRKGTSDPFARIIAAHGHCLFLEVAPGEPEPHRLSAAWAERQPS
jgi:hypothetical protein